MGFVKVQHKDGREAEITAGEVAHYRDIGFTPVAGSVIEDAGDPTQEAITPVQAPVSGTDQRLDLVLEELRGLRADIAATFVPAELGEFEPVDGETIELREPETPSANWSRGDLDAYAAAHNVVEPEKLANRQAVLDAIDAAAAGSQAPEPE